MTSRPQNRSNQFSLRSMLAGLVWLALVLAICVQYQQATAKQRESSEILRAAGITATPRVGDRPMSRLDRSAPPASEGNRTR